MATIDTHAYLSRWPFRRLAGDESPAEFTAAMRAHDVRQVWAGSFDGLLHKDIGGVNARLAAECKGSGMLVPFGSVNPALPDWQEDVRRCREVHRMPGIRLHPNYHGYTLADPRFTELLGLAVRAGLIVQLVVNMEDDRTQHPMLQVPTVDLRPLEAILPRVTGLKLTVHNQRHDAQVKKLADAGQVYFDFGGVERVRGVANLARQITPERVIFGSHFPLFYIESGLFKMRESGLSAGELQAIGEGNAAKLLSAGASR